MSYIVESSLAIGGKIIPWSNREQEKLIKEKTEMLQEKEIEDAKNEENASYIPEDASMPLREEETPIKNTKNENKKNKRR